MKKYVNIPEYLEDSANVYMFLSLRGTGKTYSTVHFLYEEALKGVEFIYLRRRLTELKETKDKIFSSVEDSEIYNRGNRYYRKGKELKEKVLDNGKVVSVEKDAPILCGYAVALSSVAPLKGIDFTHVKYVLFDEFTITDPTKSYLTGEFELFANILDTIMRTRSDVKVIMLGNKRNFYNPYTIGWDIVLGKKQKKWTGRNGKLKYYDLDSKEVAEIRFGTVIDDLFSGTTYDEWAGHDIFIDNNGGNIKKKTKSARYYFGMNVDNVEFSIWIDGLGMYVSKSPRGFGNVYTFDRKRLSDGVKFFSRQRNEIQRMRHYVLQGMLYYEDEKIKAQFVDCLRYVVSF